MCERLSYIVFQRLLLHCQGLGKLCLQPQHMTRTTFLYLDIYTIPHMCEGVNAVLTLSFSACCCTTRDWASSA